MWVLDLPVSDDSGRFENTETEAPINGFIIDAASFPGTPADVMSEIDAILESIVVGQWG